MSKEQIIDGNTSDGYHTFNELYEFRKIYKKNFAESGEGGEKAPCKF